MNSCLAGYRVVELGCGSTLAYCGKLFAEFGAEVFKVEPPGGDPGRAEPPLIDISTCRESAYFAWLNTNKSSLIADLEDSRDLDAVSSLLKNTDVLLDSRTLSNIEEGPLNHNSLRAANPHLLVTAISWFGEDGPYRNFAGSDLVARALAGLISLIGPKEKPCSINDHQADIVAGLSAFTASMAGILAGDAKRFSVSIHEANLVLAEPLVAYGQKGPRQRFGVNRFFNGYPSAILKCKEGWLGVYVGSTPQWQEFCNLFGIPEAASDPRYITSELRVQNADELERLFAPRLLERTAKEWFDEALKRKLPFAIVPSISDLLEMEIFRSLNAFSPVQIGDAKFLAPSLPLGFSDASSLDTSAAPLPGNRISPAVVKTAARTSRPIGSVTAVPPLKDVRILDLTMGWAGPLVTRQMADLGAEIVKVESCQHYDWWRGSDTRPIVFEERRYEKRPNYLVLNHNKKGITLDLRTADGVALLKRLLSRADAVVENYSREVLPKLGLDYETLRQEKPDLVMVSMPAFPRGPWENLRAYGATLEQAAGVPSIAGNPDGPPMMSHYAYGDAIGGLNATAALLMALLHRKHTGAGQHIEISQVQCMLPMIAPWIIEQSVTGQVQPRMGVHHARYVPQGCFRCSGTDDWIVISVTGDEMWRQLCFAIDRPDLADRADLAASVGRRPDERYIEEAVEAWTCAHTADDAMNILQAAGVAAGVARIPFDLEADPHLVARSFWQKVDRPWCGPHSQPSLPFREDHGPYPVYHAAPTLGEFNEEVLGGILGLSKPELVKLTEIGVIGTEAKPLSKSRSTRASASGR